MTMCRDRSSAKPLEKLVPLVLAAPPSLDAGMGLIDEDELRARRQETLPPPVLT